MPKVHTVILTDEERGRLEHLKRTRTISAWRAARATILLLSADGWPDSAIATYVGCSLSTVANVRRRWTRGGLDAALVERPPNAAPLPG